MPWRIAKHRPPVARITGMIKDTSKTSLPRLAGLAASTIIVVGIAFVVAIWIIFGTIKM